MIMAKATEADTKAAKADKPKSSNKPAKADKPNIFARFAQYLRDVRAEMKRVVWPGRQEVINSSLVVVVTLLFFVAFTFVADTLAVQALQLLSRIGG